MNIPAGLLPSLWESVAHLIFLTLVVGAAIRAPWGLLHANRLEHLAVGGAVVLVPLWAMSPGILPGLELHLLGVALLTLLLGAPLALLAATGTLVIAAAIGLYDWASLSVNGLILCALPAWLAARIHEGVQRWLPHNLFVYIFLTAYFGAMVTVMAAAAASAAVLAAAGIYSIRELLQGYLLLAPLVAFPEGFITGMIMTMLVVFKPDWVRSFDDRVYLIGK